MVSQMFRSFLFAAIITVSSQFVCGQIKAVADATYAANGKLISLTNLIDLHDCPSAGVTGKLKKVEKSDSKTLLRIRTDDRVDKNVEVDISNVSAREKKVMFRDLLRSGLRLRVSGYACDATQISAFSIDRVY